MNTAPTFQKSLSLRGKLSCELVPSKGWRDAALKGRKTMSWRISGDAVIGDELTGFAVRKVNVYLPAIGQDGVLRSPGSAIPEGGKEAADFIVGMCPKNASRSDLMDTALVKTADGETVVGADGRPVWDEAPILTESGEEFDLVFGTLFFCPTHGGLTVTASDVSLSEGKKPADGSEPFLNASPLACEVVPAKRAHALGAPLALKMQGCKQAARKPGAAPAPAPVEADIAM
jgi:hypothetical protein